MRIKGGYTRHQKHKTIRQAAKGFRGFRRRTIKGAKEGIVHALNHAYIGRKQKKRAFRRLWIVRLNAAVRNHGLSYSQFVSKLKEKQLLLDRKILSEIAYHDSATFSKIMDEIKASN